MRPITPHPSATVFSFVVCLLLLGWPISSARADFPVAPSVLKPTSSADAWNVVNVSMGNVKRLLDESRLPEIPIQIGFTAAGLRGLAKLAGTSEQAEFIPKLVDRANGWIAAVARTGESNDRPGVEDSLRTLERLIEEMKKYYEPAVLASDAFICPMHPDVVSTKAETPCEKCAMSLMKRRIPYSFIYTKPGEPSIRMSATASGPCEAGKPLEVKIRFTHADGSPAVPGDFVVMHTEPIHLLIQTPDLTDYHHEHPIHTDEPGVYKTTFTPQKTLPYRIWADIVPASSGMQELPFVDLPSPGQAGPVQDKANSFKSTVGGYTFELLFADGNYRPVAAGKTHRLNITVTDSNGQGTNNLEPVMQAFAHLVGFYEDFSSIVHLHPGGGEVLREDARGGPGLGFQFFAPKPGFIRLYCQVKIDGKMLFAPFNVTVSP